MTEIPMKGGAEYDAFTRWRRFIGWAPGERHRIKRGYRRRCRREIKQYLRSEVEYT